MCEYVCGRACQGGLPETSSSALQLREEMKVCCSLELHKLLLGPNLIGPTHSCKRTQAKATQVIHISIQGSPSPAAQMLVTQTAQLSLNIPPRDDS